jgi:hypothetical protein
MLSVSIDGKPTLMDEAGFEYNDEKIRVAKHSVPLRTLKIGESAITSGKKYTLLARNDVVIPWKSLP